MAAACKNCHVFMPTSKNVSRKKYRLPHSHATVFTRCFYHSNYVKNDSFLSSFLYKFLSSYFQMRFREFDSYIAYSYHIFHKVLFPFQTIFIAQFYTKWCQVKSWNIRIFDLQRWTRQSYVLFIYIQKSWEKRIFVIFLLT